MNKVKYLNELIKQKRQQFEKEKNIYYDELHELNKNHDENIKKIQKLIQKHKLNNKNFKNEIKNIEKLMKKIEKPIYDKEFKKVNYNKILQKDILKKKFNKDPNQVRDILRQEWQNKKSIYKNDEIKLEFERYSLKEDWFEDEREWISFEETVHKYPYDFFPITKEDLKYNSKNKLILYQDVKGLKKNKDWIQKQVEYIKNLKITDLELLIDYSFDQNDFIGIKNLEKQKRLKKIIDNSPPLEYDLIVYRGITNDYLSQQKKYFVNERFVSTSYLLHEAFKFMGDKCCIIQILLSKGTKCIFMPILSVYPEEGEILLPKGIVFKVLKKNMESINDSWNYHNTFPFQKKIIKTKIPSNFKSYIYKFFGISL